MSKYNINKNYYIEKIKDLDIDQQTILKDQINLFFDNALSQNSKNNYKIGDEVILKSNTLLHGIRTANYISTLKSIKKYGLISRTFVTGNTDWKINFCMSFWHVKKDITLEEYIKLYSGMIVKTALKENVRVPYGCFDEFFESLKDKNYRYLFAEVSPENTFMPSFSSNLNTKQLALIMYSSSKDFKQILHNNLFAKTMSMDISKKFFNENARKFLDNMEKGHVNERIAYIPFGLPSSFVEGILVGRRIESNCNLLEEIKSIFPSSYICNLDGVVIY